MVSPSEVALRLPFDVFQRYAAAAELITQVSADLVSPRTRLLDVGSGPGRLLARFLPSAGFEVFTLDAARPPESFSDPRFVIGDTAQLPFAEKTFDISCCVDVLEHLPEQLRHPAIDEMIRVTRGPVIIICPVAEDGVLAAERLANAAFKGFHGKGHYRLDEHRQAGLPSLEGLRSYLADRGGCPMQSFASGYLPRWREMIVFSLVLQAVPELETMRWP